VENCFLYGVVLWEWKKQKLNVLCGNETSLQNMFIFVCVFFFVKNDIDLKDICA
jgi:hypothetical protein